MSSLTNKSAVLDVGFRVQPLKNAVQANEDKCARRGGLKEGCRGVG